MEAHGLFGLQKALMELTRAPQFQLPLETLKVQKTQIWLSIGGRGIREWISCGYQGTIYIKIAAGLHVGT